MGHVLLTRLRASAISMCVCVECVVSLFPVPRDFYLLFRLLRINSFTCLLNFKKSRFLTFSKRKKKTFQIKSRHIGTAISNPHFFV